MADGAVYKTLLSVDARGSGSYLNGAKRRMRTQIYDLAHASFAAAGVARPMLHLEDRGDGFIAAVDARIPPVQILGTWLTELHQRQRVQNEDLVRPLGLRVGVHVGPVEHDDEGLSGEAMDLVCRLADSSVARGVLERSGHDLVCVVSESLHRDVVRHGGRFVEPSWYRTARITLKEGPVTAWFHVPGEPRPVLPGDEGLGAPPADAPTGDHGGGATAGAAAEDRTRRAGPGDIAPSAGGRSSADGSRPDGEEAGGGRWDIRVEGGPSVVQDRAVFHAPVHFGGTPAGERPSTRSPGTDRHGADRRTADDGGSEGGR